MKRVIVGSNNPVKLETVKEAFLISFPDTEFEFHTFSAPSGVSDQPIGQAETKLGATNRAEACRQKFPDADFFVGLEGGIEKIDEVYFDSAWMCVLTTSDTRGFGRTSAFALPPKVSELIDQGKELGVAADMVFNETDSGKKMGAVGILTNGTITRKEFYRDAMIFALLPFTKPDLY